MPLKKLSEREPPKNVPRRGEPMKEKKALFLNERGGHRQDGEGNDNPLLVVAGLEKREKNKGVGRTVPRKSRGDLRGGF